MGHNTTIKCMNVSKIVILSLLILFGFGQFKVDACKRSTAKFPCYACNFETFLKYIDERASDTGSTICYMDIYSSAKDDGRKTIVVSFIQDSEVMVLNDTFGVIKSKSCLIVLSGKDDNTIFKRKQFGHKRVVVYDKEILELNDGIMESFVLKDAQLFKRDWIRRQLIPLEEIYPIHRDGCK